MYRDNMNKWAKWT